MRFVINKHDGIFYKDGFLYQRIFGNNLDSIYKKAIRFLINKLNNIAKIALNDKKAKYRYKILQNVDKEYFLSVYGPDLCFYRMAESINLGKKNQYRNAFRWFLRLYNQIERKTR